MMITGATPCNPNAPVYGVSDDQDLISSSSLDANSSSQGTNPTSFLYNLSLLKDKILQIESVASIFLSPESTAIAIPTMSALIQEIIVTASSMMFFSQQISLPTTNSSSATACGGGAVVERGPSSFFSNHPDTVDHWSYSESYDRNSSEDHNNNNSMEGVRLNAPQKTETNEASENYDIVELDVADILAKYTHYCHVCGKGFKRDANLRMHMRAHGDEYKSSAALSNPMKNAAGREGERRKYSCPQEGCRWNMKHAKFQPLKSMICVKNHYKRSHCPKMYVCKKCNRKHFSVLSDLRTHEKHCGDCKWFCSCGTNFSRKDKLMGHVDLFVGHMPAINSLKKMVNAR
ncbi:hypothetical protein ACS0TY_014555 [Phlomoides rotata]